MRPERTAEVHATDSTTLRDAVGVPGGAIERARVFSSLHARMFGSSEPVRVGRFSVLERLGAGAMGIVYAAHDPDLDRKVALKILNGASSDPEVVARAEREARALARLRHPNVVTVYEVGTHAGGRFIAMDLVQGITLREWMEAPHDWREILDVFVQAARGLHAAHAAGLVHRDFKPDNVLVEEGHARVVDFGFARTPASLVTGDGGEPVDSIDEITRSGAIAGTPAYMAPEAFRGEVDVCSDVFAFCASLYEAMFGVRPFVAPTVHALLEKIEAGAFSAPLHRRKVPSWLRRATERGLAADPKRRWPGLDAWLREIEQRRRRPWRRAIVAGVGGTALGAAVVLASSRAESPCATAGEGMASIWNDARKDAIAQAFAATDLAYAEDARTRVQAAFDDRAQVWSAMRRDACEATLVRHEQSDVLLDLRMRCLDRHAEELGALVSAFETADEVVVSHAVSAARGLSPLSECADMDALSRATGRDPETAPAEMYARLAAARAGVSTGRYAAALEDARALADEAELAGHLELAARARLAIGTLEDRAADWTAAEASTRAAIALADRAGDDATRARAQTFLVSVLAQLHEVDRASEWAELARASTGRVGDPPRLQAALAASEGNALWVAGRYQEALARRREALELREEFLDEDDPQLADSHYGVGTALSNLGRNADAREEMEIALAMRRRSLGEHHPLVARAHGGLATVLMDLGRMEEAIEHLRQAIDIGSLALGPGHRFVGEAYVNLGSAVAQGPDPRASEPHFRRALEIFEAIDPGGVAAATTSLNLGRVLVHTGRAEEGVALLHRTRRAYEAALGPNHVDNVYVHNNIAIGELVLGHPAEALAQAQRAAEIGRAELGEDHGLVAEAWLHAGEAERALGRVSAAIEDLTRALAIHTRIETRTAERAVVRVALARAYLDAHRPDDAREQLALAREGFVDDPVSHAERLAEIDALLAGMDADSGR